MKCDDAHVETCCNCGMQFAMPKATYDLRQKDGKTFYCPNGHPQYYTRKKDAEAELRKQLEAMRQDRDWWKRRAEWYEHEARQNDYRARAYKGHLSRARNEIATA